MERSSHHVARQSNMMGLYGTPDFKGALSVAERSIDGHPLRYAPITREIEQILYRRALQKELEGYTLATAIEIAEAVTGSPPKWKSE